MAHLVKTLIPNVTFWIADGPPLSVADAQTTVTLDDISFSHIPSSAFASSTTVPVELQASQTTDANAPYPGLYYSDTGTRTAYLQDLGTTTGAVSVQANFVAADAALTTTQTAGASYTANEQAMLNAIKVDLANLRTTVNAELAALQVAGGPQKSS